jgi:hypothetical protein
MSGRRTKAKKQRTTAELHHLGVEYKRTTTVLQDTPGADGLLYTVGAGVFVLLKTPLPEPARDLLLKTVHVFAEAGKRAALEQLLGTPAEAQLGASMTETAQTFLESLAARDEARREEHAREDERGKQQEGDGPGTGAGDFGKGYRSDPAPATGGAGHAGEEDRGDGAAPGNAVSPVEG